MCTYTILIIYMNGPKPLLQISYTPTYATVIGFLSVTHKKNDNRYIKKKKKHTSHKP